MKRCLILLVLAGCAGTDTSTEKAKGTEPAATADEKPKGDNPVVAIKTNRGTIKVELFQKDAPITVKNFLKYVDDKHYDDTVFHRVISDFMIQGGGFTKDVTKAGTAGEIRKAEKKTGKPIKNESANGKSNKRGTIAMARTPDPDSATAQFFINVVDNSKKLDRTGNDDDEAGYCVFGRVIEGMNVVDKIKEVKTKELIRGFKDVPVESVIIESIRREAKKKKEEPGK
jgi:cyclophilin family peptidyl-prolyl cis-trans isomerase